MRDGLTCLVPVRQGGGGRTTRYINIIAYVKDGKRWFENFWVGLPNLFADAKDFTVRVVGFRITAVYWGNNYFSR